MNKNRKTLKMPVRYLMNAVLVVLLFLALSYMTGNMLSTYQNKVLMTVGINIFLAVSLNGPPAIWASCRWATPVSWPWVLTPAPSSPSTALCPMAFPLPSALHWAL